MQPSAKPENPLNEKLQRSLKKEKSTDLVKYGKLQVFSGRANIPLGDKICEHLGLEAGKVDLGTFPDGELNVHFLESVRGNDVFVIQPTSTPVNDNLMELILMLSTLKKASASRVTAVIPYYGYARQDRKCKPRVPISA